MKSLSSHRVQSLKRGGDLKFQCVLDFLMAQQKIHNLSQNPTKKLKEVIKICMGGHGSITISLPKIA